jgi:hypothetical protein
MLVRCTGRSVGPREVGPTKAAMDVATPVIVCTPLAISSM